MDRRLLPECPTVDALVVSQAVLVSDEVGLFRLIDGYLSVDVAPLFTEGSPSSPAAEHLRTLRSPMGEQTSRSCPQPRTGQVADQITNTPRNSRVCPPAPAVKSVAGQQSAGCWWRTTKTLMSAPTPGSRR